MGYSPWGRKELDMTERLHFTSAFFIVQLSHPYMTTGKIIALTESESEVTQSCPTLCDPMDCSLPGSSVHGIFQARVLKWVAISFSRGSSQPRD